MKRVGIYLRVSTVEQAEKGWSLDGQYEDIRSFCEKQEGWRVTLVFRDEGYSAADLNRPGMQRLLDAVQDHALDVMVVWKYDRLSRDNIDFPVLLHVLEKHGVQLLSVNEPSLGDDSPYGEFVVGMLGLIATLERRVLQTRVKMGMRERSRRGLWHGGIPPFGYAYDESSGKLVPSPEEASIVREAFDHFLSTQCLYETRDALRSKGYRTRSGKDWSVPELRRLLRRKTYVGFLHASGVIAHDESLNLVSQSDFRRVQDLLEDEKGIDGREGRLMKHQFGGKAENPPCPQCENHVTTRKRGKRMLADGSGRQLYWCNLCKRTFDRATSGIPIPRCPTCLKRDGVQYFGQWRSVHRIEYRVFGCRECGNRFRLLVED